MKMLNKEKFAAEAGVPLFHNRDFSLYDGTPYECACGSVHTFHQYRGVQHFGSTGINAKFMIQCPNHVNIFTLIKTKYKFVFIFDEFTSLAGYIGDKK